MFHRLFFSTSRRLTPALPRFATPASPAVTSRSKPLIQAAGILGGGALLAYGIDTRMKVYCSGKADNHQPKDEVKPTNGTMQGEPPKPLSSIIVLSGPSGAGKSTLLKRLFAEFPNTFGFSVSHTTRKPRPGEVDGKDYYFVTKEEMQKEISEGKFIESATFSGNMYGTSIMAVERVVETGKVCILDIDMQGVQQIKKTNLNPRYIFIQPPSLKILESRLRGRGTETEENIAQRLAASEREINYSKEEGSYDFVVINDDIEKAYQDLKEGIFGKI
ncbi:uncharacterized protein VTP21DRAFT_5788 [Calcarisporiella thermophila]|uniref:uncharacterized protein n=1 Tax=Calcarisporiella thermophila TaxID=911321 RepID=UPI003742E25B